MDDFSFMNAVFPNSGGRWQCHDATGYIRGCGNPGDVSWANNEIGTSSLLAKGSAPDGSNTSGGDYLVSTSCEADVAILNQKFDTCTATSDGCNGCEGSNEWCDACTETERYKWFSANPGVCGKIVV
jgi:hypothetical protein